MDLRVAIIAGSSPQEGVTAKAVMDPSLDSGKEMHFSEPHNGSLFLKDNHQLLTHDDVVSPVPFNILGFQDPSKHDQSGSEETQDEERSSVSSWNPPSHGIQLLDPILESNADETNPDALGQSLVMKSKEGRVSPNPDSGSLQPLCISNTKNGGQESMTIAVQIIPPTSSDSVATSTSPFATQVDSVYIDSEEDDPTGDQRQSAATRRRKLTYKDQRATWHSHSHSSNNVGAGSHSRTPCTNLGDSNVTGGSSSSIKPRAQVLRSSNPVSEASSKEFDSLGSRSKNILHDSTAWTDEDSLSTQGRPSVTSMDSRSYGGDHHAHHHVQLTHHPESHQREHWVTSNHKQHKHESLLSKLFHFNSGSLSYRESHDRDFVTSDQRFSAEHPEHTPSDRSSIDKSLQHLSDDLPYTSSPKAYRDSPHSFHSTNSSPERTASKGSFSFMKKKDKKGKHHYEEEHSNSLFKELLTNLTLNPHPTLPSPIDRLQRIDSNISQMSSVSASIAPFSTKTFSDKYGHVEEVLGKGAQATVRLVSMNVKYT